MARCLRSCRPSRPCCRPGCANAVQIATGNSAQYGDMGFEANRNTIRGGGRTVFGSDNTARWGDQDIHMNDNKVLTSRGVKMGSGNTAGRNMRMSVSGNTIG